MLKAPSNLPSDVAQLQALIALQNEKLSIFAAEIQERDYRIEKLKHELAGLRRHRFGSRSEALDQLELTLEEEEIARAAATPPGEDNKADQTNGEKRKPRRKPLPEHLHRNDQVLSPGEACNACGGSLKTLGEDITEELEYVPGRFVVNRIVRPRMACSCCEQICQAPLPSRPIEKGLPGPGLLAHVLVNKYADHSPLYRQSQIFEREGIDLDRSTLAGWVGKSTALLEPLAAAIQRHVLSGQAIFADDTPVDMLSPVARQANASIRREGGVLARPRRRACGPMSVMKDHGEVRRHRQHSTASRATARASSRRSICRIIPAGCMRMAMLALMNCIDQVASVRSPAWPTSPSRRL
jgi:transposase